MLEEQKMSSWRKMMGNYERVGELMMFGQKVGLVWKESDAVKSVIAT